VAPSSAEDRDDVGAKSHAFPDGRFPRGGQGDWRSLVSTRIVSLDTRCILEF
jgi:hypothetical protein